MSTLEPKDGEEPPPAGRPFLWTSVAVFAGLTALLFWRYALSPRTAICDAGDSLFLLWTLEWVGRALLHSPRELFHAPMFHPFTDTLAYSDPLLPESLVALPLRLVGFGPIAAYNAVYLGAIVLAGVLTTLLFFQLTRHRPAALVGAVVATFPALRLYHLAHLQLQVTTFLPLALLLVHRVLRRPSARSAAALGITLAGAALASLYYGLFLALLLPPFALVAWCARPRRDWAALLALSGAATTGGVLLFPIGRVYTRAITHLALERTERGFSDILDYFSVSWFADISHLLPPHLLRDGGPEWVGGGAAVLLPIAAVGIAIAALRSRLQRGRFGLSESARVALPYTVLGCLAISLSLGPKVQWDGHTLFKSPLSHLLRLPGVNGIRDFQRLGFLVAIAGGAIVAVGLAELARRGHRRVTAVGLTLAAVSTVVPAFSSSLPVYRPAEESPIGPLEEWIERQPEPFVFFEVPLSRRGEERLDYLWTSIHHKKRLVHGFSGYLPRTDDALRAETRGVHRPDFFRTLALLGATHLVVHTRTFAALPGGAASLAWLRDARDADRVAQFPGAEVYRVDAMPFEKIQHAGLVPEEPIAASGGWVDPQGRCIEFDRSTLPLVFYTPQSARVAGLHFVADMPIGELDDALLIERCDDLQTWRVAPHRALLSETIASYLEKPTPLLQTDARIAPEAGPFLRLSSRRNLRLRLCDLSIISGKATSVESVPRQALHLETHVGRELAPLAIDGDRSTRWQSGSLQQGNEWIEIDLGGEREVAAVVLDLGQTESDYGRKLAVDCGDARERLVLGAELDARDTIFTRPHAEQVLPLAPPRSCKVLRVRQTGHSPDNYWSVAEITVLERAGHTKSQ